MLGPFFWAARSAWLIAMGVAMIPTNPRDKNIPTLHAGPRLRSLFWERTVLSVREGGTTSN